MPILKHHLLHGNKQLENIIKSISSKRRSKKSHQSAEPRSQTVVLHCTLMYNTSTDTLKLLASLVWYSGAVVLSFKSSRLLREAQSINPDKLWIGLAVFGGLIIGAIKAKYLFKRLCIKNLKRIDALEQPKLWHFYRMRFFFFLLAMIILGSSISRLAHGSYATLMTMAIIEVSLATALIGSSNCFWKKQ